MLYTISIERKSSPGFAQMLFLKFAKFGIVFKIMIKTWFVYIRIVNFKFSNYLFSWNIAFIFLLKIENNKQILLNYKLFTIYIVNDFVFMICLKTIFSLSRYLLEINFVWMLILVFHKLGTDISTCNKFNFQLSITPWTKENMLLFIFINFQ